MIRSLDELSREYKRIALFIDSSDSNFEWGRQMGYCQGLMHVISQFEIMSKNKLVKIIKKLIASFEVHKGSYDCNDLSFGFTFGYIQALVFSTKEDKE